MAVAKPLTMVTGPNLKQRLARAERVNRLKAQALILPLVLFLVLVFLVPIVALLVKSVGNPEVVGSLPRTVAALQQWDGKALPAEPAYQALSLDLAEAQKFIAFSVQPQQQKIYSENIAYGPANKLAVPLLPPALLKDMPTTPENIANQVPMDVVFWADYGEQLEQRFNAWAAK